MPQSRISSGGSPRASAYDDAEAAEQERHLLGGDYDYGPPQIMDSQDLCEIERRHQPPINWRPALQWAGGAVGAGLVQAGLATSSRRDAGPVQLSLAGSAMGIGTWLYGNGVRQTLLDAIEHRQDGALGEGAVAAGALVGSTVGIALAAFTPGPLQLGGLGLLVAASAGYHHALARAFIRGETAVGQERRLVQDGGKTLKDAREFVVWLGAVGLIGGVAAAYFGKHLGVVEGAAAVLFAHALIGTCISTYFAVGRHQEARAHIS